MPKTYQLQVWRVGDFLEKKATDWCGFLQVMNFLSHKDDSHVKRKKRVVYMKVLSEVNRGVGR
jgi:hypothetical protein